MSGPSFIWSSRTCAARYPESTTRFGRGVVGEGVGEHHPVSPVRICANSSCAGLSATPMSGAVPAATCH